MKGSISEAVLLAGLMLIAISTTSSAAPVFWTDWTSATTNQVDGSLDVGGTSVDVTYSGSYSFANTNGGTNYWIPVAPYLSSEVDNGPPDSDIVALNAGGTVTITFSQAVVDPLLALVSWNGNTVDFGTPIEILSFDRGFWGDGTPQLNQGGTGFFGAGEVHGVIRLPGSFTEITISHTSENWHGFTVGVFGVDDGGNGGGEEPSVPEPGSLGLFGLGVLGLYVRSRKRRQA